MSGQFEIYYWPLAGRAEFIRLIFEEAGVPYKDVTIKGYDTLKDMKNGHYGYPGFAPPMLKKGDFVLFQTPVICKYLAKQFSMWPVTEEDEWHADQINTTIHDFIAEGRLVFHGKGFVKSYYDQKEETQPYIDWFISDRFHVWLGLLEATLKANNGGNGFVLGTKLTYVDLALLHVLRAAKSQFPDPWEKLESIPLLKGFLERMAARPNLAAYFSSERCRPFEGNSMM